jgi:hypothetical protein
MQVSLKAWITKEIKETLLCYLWLLEVVLSPLPMRARSDWQRESPCFACTVLSEDRRKRVGFLLSAPYLSMRCFFKRTVQCVQPFSLLPPSKPRGRGGRLLCLQASQSRYGSTKWNGLRRAQREINQRWSRLHPRSSRTRTSTLR